MKRWLEGGGSKSKRGEKHVFKRSLRVESLEHRRVLAAPAAGLADTVVQCGNPSLVPSQSQTADLPVGNPLVQINSVITCESRESAKFVIELSEAPTQVVQVLFETFEGSAQPGDDYLPSTQILTFLAGQTRQTATVVLREDNTIEPDRQFGARVGILNADGSIETHHRVLLASPSPVERIIDVQVSEDGRHAVAARINPSPVQHVEVVSMALDGSRPPVRISPVPGVPNPSTEAWVYITRDGENVVFVVQDDVLNQRQLFRAPIDGSMPATRLSPAIDGFGLTGVSDVRVSPNERWVAFRARGFQSPSNELYLVRLDGSAAPQRISVPGQNVGTFEFSPDGSRLVYDTTNSGGRVLAVTLDGQRDTVDLTASLRGDYKAGSFQISESGSHVVYCFSSMSLPGLVQLFRAPIDGTALPQGIATATTIESLRLTPDGRHAVYLDRVVSDFARGLFQVPLSGPSIPTRLDRPSGSELNVQEFQVDSEGRYIYFSGQSDSADRSDVYRVAVDGSDTPLRLSEARRGQNASAIQLTPDGTMVVYQLSSSANGQTTTELYRVLSDQPGSQIRLNGPLVSGGSLLPNVAPTISEDSLFIAYVADQDIDGKPELFHTRLDGRSFPQKVVDLPEMGAAVTSSDAPLIATSQNAYVYVSRNNGVDQLNVSSLFSSGTATLIDGGVVAASYGDAPSSAQSNFAQNYPVTLGELGARHVRTDQGLYFGASANYSLDGTHVVRAERAPMNWEGFAQTESFVVGDTAMPAEISVTVHGVGKLDAWVDFNQDGDWNDRWEQIAAAVPVYQGENRIQFSIPEEALAGGTAARFRVSRDGGLNPTGTAIGGEVEDIWIQIEDGKSGDETSVVRLPLGRATITTDSQTVLATRDSQVLAHAPNDPSVPLKFIGGIGPDTVSYVLATEATGKQTLDGNHGRDTLQLVVASNPGLPTGPSTPALVDLRETSNLVVQNFETIDLSRSGDIELMVDPFLGTAHGEAVTIKGDAGDRLTLEHPEQWRMGAATLVGDQFLRQLIHQDGARLNVDFPTIWRNVVRPLDVNNSGDVSPLDALVIINRLALMSGNSSAGLLPDALDATPGANLFYDTTGDNRVTPLDALRVINSLASGQAASGEAESDVFADIPDVSVWGAASEALSASSIDRWIEQASLEDVTALF